MESRGIANYTIVKLAVTDSADGHLQPLSIVMGVQDISLKQSGRFTPTCVGNTTVSF
jgi:hypothetical protein